MKIEPIIQNTAGYQGSVSDVTAKQVVETNSETVPKEAAQDTVVVTNNQTNRQQPEADASKQNEKIKRAVENINKMNPQTEALFGIHEGTNRVTIKIVDKDTKEVIKEYPPEKTLDMIEKIWEMAGIMVDEKR